MTFLYSRLLKSLVPITLVTFSLLPLFANDQEVVVENNVTTEIVEKIIPTIASNDTDASILEQETDSSSSLAGPSGSLRGVDAAKGSKAMSTNDKEQDQEESHE